VIYLQLQYLYDVKIHAGVFQERIMDKINAYAVQPLYKKPKRNFMDCIEYIICRM